MRSTFNSWLTTFAKLGLRNGARRRSEMRHQGHARRLAIELLEQRRMLATLTVSTHSDNTSVDNDLTLREAIHLVNGTLGRPLQGGELNYFDDMGGAEPLGVNDTIVFDPEHFSEPRTITLHELMDTGSRTHDSASFVL